MMVCYDVVIRSGRNKPTRSKEGRKMFKKSMLVLFIAVALLSATGLPASAASGAGSVFCGQDLSGCGASSAAVTGATSYTMPASGAALSLPQIVPASPYGEVFTGNDLPE
jgi:hypothetical protein